MRRGLGIARCGLACCLCSESERCGGCDSGLCPDAATCEVRACSAARGLSHCFECAEPCRRGILAKLKPYAFTEFARRFGEEHLLDCLERNEAAGTVYHREGIVGDYDDFGDLEGLIAFIEAGPHGVH
ncbi:MAG TPA: DUF3795 domain-containing protein [Candidatus Olsenella pullistercoris]|uniref:DUF3795 domain-containing protein n=1 Tax=Candidatus Olsenella pullistercoris TaxID=2838712 RepID=A0A9D2EXN6_9ACTN|nr:DUF3795 domain-containing protein [Candidatus Olsenella pullistercoris]